MPGPVRALLVPAHEDCAFAEEDVPGPVRALLVPAREDDGAAPGIPERRAPRAEAPLRIAYEAGQSLSEAVFLSGQVPSPVLCAGHALCGRCRLRILAAPGSGVPPPLPADSRRLSGEEIARGFRLSCRHEAEAGMLLEIPVSGRPRRAPVAGPSPVPRPKAASPADGRFPSVRTGKAALSGAYCSLALDLGTTTLHWRLLSPREEEGSGKREVLWEDMRSNPQAGAGGDVVSRMAYAQKPGGGATLRALILDALRDIVRESLRRALAAGYAGMDGICAAGNPVMTALLLGRKISGPAHTPKFLPFPGEENIAGLPPLIIAPQPSSFIGGDIAAGYAALALDPGKEPPDFPFLLADMGTNGEFLLALSPDAALTCSVALGPALEGAGLYSGTEARPGAAADFLLEADGMKALALPDDFSGTDAVPRRAGPDEILPGMTGAACLSLIAILRRCGVINREGLFTAEAAGLPGRFFIPQRDTGGERFIVPGYGLRLYASDVERVLKVKAAFSLGMRLLPATAGIASSDISAFYLAGSLGKHVRKDALEELGFIAPGTGKRLKTPGNTSLAGAELLLRRPETLEKLQRRTAGMRNLDLASDPEFARNFAASMHF